jgi:hypothetical protein
MHKVNYNWQWQTLVLGQRMKNKLFLLLNGVFQNRANIAKTICSTKQTFLIFKEGFQRYIPSDKSIIQNKEDSKHD